MNKIISPFHNLPGSIWGFSILIIFAALFAPVKLKIESPTPQTSELLLITKIIDGDTVRLENGKVVRLIGINTPEIGNKSECFGQEAANYANTLLLNKKVKLEKDVSETDRYNRWLRYIWLDGELINEKLVADGYAQVATYPPDVKYQDRFLATQIKTRESSLGLWSGCIIKSTGATNYQPNI